MINPLKMVHYATKVVAVPVKKKARTLAKYVGVSTISATVALPLPKLMNPILRDEVVLLKKAQQTVKPKTSIAYPFNNYAVSWEALKDNATWGLDVSFLKLKKDTIFEKQWQTVLKIMEDDKACLHPNKEQVANNIVKISRMVDVDPIVVACIAKKESHFSQKSIAKSPKGVMQIVEITVKDMFQREHLYHSRLKELKQVYPTQEKLFQAIQTNALVNMEVGAITYGMKLQQAKGDVFNALRKYNASPLKDDYAKTVYSDIVKYRKFYNNLEI